MTAAFMVLGYLGVIAVGGWWGVLAAVAHLGLMLAALPRDQSLAEPPVRKAERPAEPMRNRSPKG